MIIDEGATASICNSWLLVASMLPALSKARYLTVVPEVETVNAPE